MEKVKVTGRQTDGDVKRGKKGKSRRRQFGAQAAKVTGRVTDLDTILSEASSLDDLR